MKKVNKDSNVLIRTMSSLVSRMQLAARAGLTFSGSRDFYQVFGWKRQLEFNDLLAKYERQDIAGRVVDTPAEATWRNPPTVTGHNDFISAWNTVSRHGVLWSMLERADKLAAMGQFSICVLGFDNTRVLSSPVSQGGHKNLQYLKPFGQNSVKVLEYEQRQGNARFGLPTRYKISIQDPTTTSTGKQVPFEVHWSRVVHIAEMPLDSDLFGYSKLIRVANLLDDIMKVAGGTAENYWLSGNRGLQADLDKDMEISSTDAAQLADEIEEYQHQLRRVLRTRGVDIKSLGSETPDPRGAFEVLSALLSGATGIPQRILFGSEAGQLASEQDRANWADRVEERRVSYAQPYILIPLIQRLQYAGVLPEEDDFGFEWPPAFKLSPLEQAQMMAQTGRAIANMSRRGKEGNPILSDEECRTVLGVPAKPNLSDTFPEPFQNTSTTTSPNTTSGNTSGNTGNNASGTNN